MTEKFFRMCRSGISLLLAVCMLIGMIPGAALTAKAEENPIVLVSIGDSMTNG